MLSMRKGKQSASLADHESFWYIASCCTLQETSTACKGPQDHHKAVLYVSLSLKALVYPLYRQGRCTTVLR